MQDALRVRHCSIRTETSCLDWATRFILFHHKRQPRSEQLQPIVTAEALDSIIWGQFSEMPHCLVRHKPILQCQFLEANLSHNYLSVS